MRRSNFALRLQPSLMEEARKASEAEGVALNQFINVALAEKVSALRTEDYFRERASRANRGETLRILARSGKHNPPREEDTLPPGRKSSRGARKAREKSSLAGATGKHARKRRAPQNR